MKGAFRFLILGFVPVLVLGRPSQVVARGAFSDVPRESQPTYDAVRDPAAKGILRGSPAGRFDGKRAVTRGECFLVFARILSWFYEEADKKPGPYPRLRSSVPLPAPRSFADVPLHGELGDAISILAHIGLLDGHPDQTLRPQQPMTRDEFEAARQRLQRWIAGEMVLLGYAREPVPSTVKP